MPTLDELARLGKQALLAFVAPLLHGTRCPEARVEELLAENAALRAQLDQLQEGSQATSGPVHQGPTRSPAQTHRTYSWPGPLLLPHPANSRPRDRTSDRGPTAQSDLSLLW